MRWHESAERKQIAKRLDGGYLLKTDRKNLTIRFSANSRHSTAHGWKGVGASPIEANS